MTLEQRLEGSKEIACAGRRAVWAEEREGAKALRTSEFKHQQEGC